MCVCVCVCVRERERERERDREREREREREKERARLGKNEKINIHTCLFFSRVDSTCHSQNVVCKLRRHIIRIGIVRHDRRIQGHYETDGWMVLEIAADCAVWNLGVLEIAG